MYLARRMDPPAPVPAVNKSTVLASPLAATQHAPPLSGAADSSQGCSQHLALPTLHHLSLFPPLASAAAVVSRSISLIISLLPADFAWPQPTIYDHRSTTGRKGQAQDWLFIVFSDKALGNRRRSVLALRIVALYRFIPAALTPPHDRDSTVPDTASRRP
ncbi:hypothetical protein NUW58_g8384 [Xylaria curta]|uniref:Uncharacterized protein n=1 Tax=Xylaria curta TaxID=42375 RepID=A0ACC1N8T2_9PEZI|nr:hypothetical protein NUW58_g8384 [Xylaria curta]